MITDSEVEGVIGRDVYGSDGEKIGRAGQVYLDDDTGRPEWVTVNIGLFGMSESFVPLGSAELSGDRLTVPFDKDRVKNAPNVDPQSGHLSPDAEGELYRYYGERVGGGAAGGLTDEDRHGDTRDLDVTMDRGRVSDRPDDTDDISGGGGAREDAMTRSEEQLSVGTESREAGRARLRKYVTTEQQTVTVPVTREEVRVEREPITDANRDDALSGPDISEAEHEVTLHEERPVVDKETVPVERVRLEKDQVTDEEQVTEDVRTEHIETEGAAEDRDLRDR